MTASDEAPDAGQSPDANRTLALRRLVEELEPLVLQDHEDLVRERIEALDRLEMHLLPHDRGQAAEDAGAMDVEQRACALRFALEAKNQALYRTMRREIIQGRPNAMLQHVRALQAGAGNDSTSGEGYDDLDELVGGVLRWHMPGPPQAAMEEGLVFYQPTPARHVFDLIERAAPGKHDVVVDLGSGLGHVVLLAAICTAARCIGIEREAAYVDSARRSARALRTDNAIFIRCDARMADFSTGTLFYFYTPFLGDVLRTVLDALHVQAALRDIRIAALGPCVPIIAAEPWLKPAGEAKLGRVALFEPRR